MTQDHREFFRADGSIDMERAMRAGRRVRAEAFREGIAEVKRVFAGEPRVQRRIYW
ncbi:hypothetical protein [Ovoidimarina sediminis]|uniref:hypothetical protein n=1 Tax=Ovoidimarina sediminis TaxID=3079856 RepID=UPI002906258F|nr:hypothetical protein [Rhodophyticola sp. MJ-SS7]MDU8945591.1 hypothetical protein [Rhodophyticola sp. MJ-SS7]